MIDSKIQWCEDTVNVVEGCSQVDEDCRGCYAMGIAARFAQDQVVARLEDGTPMETKQGHYAGLARLSPGRRLPQWTGKVRLRPDVLDKMFWRLLRARAPRRQFLCSMGDIFHAEVPDAFLDEVFARIAILESRREIREFLPGDQDHQILMLTKRPERAAVYTHAPDVAQRVETAARSFIERERTAAFQLTSRKGLAKLVGFVMPPWPLRSVALITSAGTQAGADARVPWLLRCKAVIKGVSCEPMTGPVDFSRWIAPHECCDGCGHIEPGLRIGKDGAPIDACVECGDSLITTWGDRQTERWESGERYANGGPHEEDEGPPLNWIILGGESGDMSAEEDRRPRPCELAWMDDVAAQCKAAGTRLFVKQLGHVLAAKLGREGKGGKLEDLPPHLRIREFPRTPERA